MEIRTKRKKKKKQISEENKKKKRKNKDKIKLLQLKSFTFDTLAEKRDFLKSKAYYLQTNSRTHILLKKLKIRCTLRFWKRYIRLTDLREKLKSIPKPQIAYKPWLFFPSDTTQRSSWLESAYAQYPEKKRPWDFLRNVLGSALLMSHQQTYITKNLYLRNKIFTNKIQKIPPTLLTKTVQKKYLDHFIFKKKLTWWYSYLRVQKLKKTSKESNKLYKLFWMQSLKTPWLESLIFKKRLYNNMVGPYRGENKWGNTPTRIKKSFRTKTPNRTKRNKLYYRYEKLFCTAGISRKINNKKKARMYQIMGKIVSGFYGGLTQKQFSKMWYKTKKKKSLLETHSDLFLNKFESRLDVLVYRLNLAPNILWARRLIWDGGIFINSVFEIKTWTSLYSSLKLYAFPLSLRDPQKVYSKSYWNPSKKYSKSKFFVPPVTNEAYIVRPDEIIQYNPSLNSYDFKFQPFLFKKSINENLLTQSTASPMWYWKKRSRRNLYIAKNQQEVLRGNASYLLQTTQHRNFDNKQDRIREGFLNWIIL